MSLRSFAGLGLALALLVVPAVAEDKKDPTKDKEAFRKFTVDKAISVAKAEKKIVMIDFYADWCGPCKLMDAKTFKHEKVDALLKEKLVAVKVNIDNQEAVAGKYKIEAVPTFVFLDGDGKEVGRFLGFHDAEKFMDAAKKYTK